jgi:uncharacterized membrane protein
MSIYATIYAVLVICSPIPPYGPLQIRVADALVATIPLFGFAGVLGHTLGVFIANGFSPEGLIDLLNAIPSFVMAFIVYYIHKKTNNDYTIIATCIAYSAVIGTTVGWMLSYLYSLPLMLTIMYITAGNIVASVLIGWPLFKLLKKIGITQVIGQETKREGQTT